jgi:hypothetical protein
MLGAYAFKNKILLEYSHGHSFMFCSVWIFLAIKEELLPQRLHSLKRLKYLLSGPLKKKLTNPAL